VAPLDPIQGIAAAVTRRTLDGKRTKHQIPNTKLQRNPKLQIPKPVAGSLPWSLGLGASLEFGVWSFN
jgi:hypothetical protein